MSISRDGTIMQASLDGEFESPTMVPDMDKRNLMNLILLTAVGANVGALGVPFLLFFVPRSKGGDGGGLVARDRNGDAVTLKGW
jgi:cytochrome b6-f complex iron-sulfur subunit